jgi:hypothetical protein
MISAICLGCYGAFAMGMENWKCPKVFEGLLGNHFDNYSINYMISPSLLSFILLTRIFFFLFNQ